MDYIATRLEEIRLAREDLDGRTTEWIPISKPPVIPGIYNVSCVAMTQSGDWFSYWDGDGFMSYSLSPDGALDLSYANDRGAGPGTMSWRGLKVKP